MDDKLEKELEEELDENLDRPLDEIVSLDEIIAIKIRDSIREFVAIIDDDEEFYPDWHDEINSIGDWKNKLIEISNCFDKYIKTFCVSRYTSQNAATEGFTLLMKYFPDLWY